MAISEALRNKLRKEKEELESGSGIIIDSRQISKSKTLRMLPVTDEIGVTVYDWYCREIGDHGKGGGTTSPATYGIADPVYDELQKQRMQATSKEERQALRDTFNYRREHWIGVIDRDDPGTVDAPKIKILRCKVKPYKAIVNQIIGADEDDEGYDCTDPQTGLDFIYKKDEQDGNTSYSIARWKQPSPLAHDEDYVDAVLAAWEDFDIWSYIFRPNIDTLNEIYAQLTGEDIDDETREKIEEGVAEFAGSDTGDESGEEEEEEEESEDEGDGEGDEEEAEPETEFEDGMEVSFEYEDETYTGTITSRNEEDSDDKENVWDVQVGDDVWAIPESLLTVAEPAEEEEEEEEEEEQEVKPGRKRSSGSASSKLAKKSEQKKSSPSNARKVSTKKKTTKKASTSKKPSTKKKTTKKASTSKKTTKKAGRK